MKRITHKILLVFALLGILSVQSAFAQLKIKNYKDLGEVTFYGIVFNGTKIIKADRTATDYMKLFEDLNQYYQDNPDAIASCLKRNYRLVLKGVNSEYALQANSKINELGLFSYKNHTAPATLQALQVQLNRLKIPKADGYGLILFSSSIDLKERELNYDMVFFDCKTMRIMEFGKADYDTMYKDIYKDFKQSVPDSIQDYLYSNR